MNQKLRKIYPKPIEHITIQNHDPVREKSSTGAHDKRSKSPHNCEFCGKTFANRSNLKRHHLNKHSDKVGSFPNPNLFTCDNCKCTFSNKSSLKRHIENLHLQTKNPKKSISCVHCEQTFNSIKYLNAHLKMAHDVKIDEQELRFSNLDAFFSWKKQEEIRTNTRFIQLRGMRKHRRQGEEIMTLKFICNRSGVFHSKSNGKRAYRVKGSSKIGRYCSAYIAAMFKENDYVNSTYCSTHCGHDNDLRYLNLTMDDKREIYEKIQKGATFSSILNEIRNNVGKEIKRKHLVTNKDLHNIVTTFKKTSKPVQDNTSAHSSPSVLPESSNDLSMVKNENIFHSELDLCADLWVDTCEQIANRFDQNESRVNEPAKTVTVQNSSFVTENITQDRRIKEPSVNADYSRILYINQHDYSVNNSSNTPRQSHNSTNHAPEELNNSTYSSSTTQMKDFSGMSNDLRLDDDFNPIEVLEIEDHTLNNTEISINSHGGYDNSRVNRSQINLKNKLPSNSNVIVIPVRDTNDSYSIYPDKLPSASNSESNPLSQSTDDEDPSNYDPICDITISSDESETPAENQDQPERSDLRDKVNSVTALYNIVESELDERKKNIIRNYVDNMFRVLQHRYNKTKTRKKPESPKKIANKEKKPKTQLQTTNKKRKTKVPDLIPAKFSVSEEYATEVADTSYTDPSHISFGRNTRATEQSDPNAMRWDRF
ncbi:uncharacterized protein LOC135839254 [Planococcus citri]|uniref:uncharacterized protein LOC135839254 n=1 Tax=Planococcus citri TaxID=170843 RepID=UPI0031F8370C